MKFSGKKILITGGSSKIGLGLAKASMEKGLFPILTYRNDNGLTKIKESLEDEKFYETLMLDFKNPEVISDSLKSFSKIDYLVDLVHGNMETIVANADLDKTKEYYEENVISRIVLMKEISRLMVKNRFGRLIYISSIAAHRPNHGQGFYASSKLACESLYKSIGHELGKKGVTSIVLRPGYINAGRAESFIGKFKEKIIKQIPSRKILEAEEFVNTIVFFLSDESLGFNATDLTIDGGFSFGKSF
ncbi:MAG: SDR family oxidoreductase [Desulfobacterales bacterium]|nr:SDR family oxidoreductase [Desulfobacterales bacterium]MCP4162865.1 SDR family oxidoreductase [Deltaproteobacteria bacterium]